MSGAFVAGLLGVFDQDLPFLPMIDYTRPKKKNVVFPLSLPTLIFGADPKLFIAIFKEAPLKSESPFYITLLKKIDKIKKIPYLPTQIF